MRNKAGLQIVSKFTQFEKLDAARVDEEKHLSLEEMSEYCRGQTVRILDALMVVIERGKEDARYGRETVSAAQLLLAYGYGKPIDQSVTLVAQVNAADIARIVEQRRRESGRSSLLTMSDF